MPNQGSSKLGLPQVKSWTYVHTFHYFSLSTVLAQAAETKYHSLGSWWTTEICFSQSWSLETAGQGSKQGWVLGGFSPRLLKATLSLNSHVAVRGQECSQDTLSYTWRLHHHDTTTSQRPNYFLIHPIDNLDFNMWIWGLQGHTNIGSSASISHKENSVLAVEDPIMNQVQLFCLSEVYFLFLLKHTIHPRMSDLGRALMLICLLHPHSTPQQPKPRHGFKAKFLHDELPPEGLMSFSDSKTPLVNRIPGLDSNFLPISTLALDKLLKFSVSSFSHYKMEAIAASTHRVIMKVPVPSKVLYECQLNS